MLKFATLGGGQYTHSHDVVLFLINSSLPQFNAAGSQTHPSLLSVTFIPGPHGDLHWHVAESIGDPGQVADLPTTSHTHPSLLLVTLIKGAQGGLHKHVAGSTGEPGQVAALTLTSHTHFSLSPVTVIPLLHAALHWHVNGSIGDPGQASALALTSQVQPDQVSEYDCGNWLSHEA